jgi:hypothetical protein
MHASWTLGIPCLSPRSRLARSRVSLRPLHCSLNKNYYCLLLPATTNKTTSSSSRATAERWCTTKNIHPWVVHNIYFYMFQILATSKAIRRKTIHSITQMLFLLQDSKKIGCCAHENNAAGGMTNPIYHRPHSSRAVARSLLLISHHGRLAHDVGCCLESNKK